MAHTRGFTLLEVLIVVAILGILSAAGVGYFRNVVQQVSSESITKILISDLRTAQAKAAAGEASRKWGIHAVNGATQYYQLFSTPSNYADAQTSIEATTTFATGFLFTDPAAGMMKDIIFGGIGGTTTPTTLAITNEGKTTTITITSLGTIY